MLASSSLRLPGAGKHKMISKLATQSLHILRLIARNPNFSRPKVPYFNISRLLRLHFWAIWGNFGPFWVIFSRDSRETLKYGTFGRKKFGFRAMSRRIWKLCVASLLIILCFPESYTIFPPNNAGSLSLQEE